MAIFSVWMVMQFDSQNIQNIYVFQNYKKEQSGL